MKNSSYVVGIAGGTCSGKTTLATRLAEKMADLEPTVIYMDRYYKNPTPNVIAQITRIEYVPDRPEETVEFDFEVNADDVVAGFGEMRTGTVRLLPERGWTPQEMRLNSNRGGKPFVNTRVFTYGEKNGEPFQVRHAQTKLYFNPDDETKFVSWDYEIREIDRAKAPKKELYLKYYGLDEPEFADPHTGLRFLLFIAGVLIVLLAVRRMRRRKQSGTD